MTSTGLTACLVILESEGPGSGGERWLVSQEVEETSCAAERCMVSEEDE